MCYDEAIDYIFKGDENMANKAVPKKTGNTVAAAAKKAVETTGKAAKAAAAKAAAGAVKPEPEKKIQKDPHIFSDLDQYLFGQATHYELYKKMGAHTAVVNGEPGTWFTVWAPNAVAVYVIGEFNCWNEKANPMKKIADMGICEIFVPGAEVGQMYKYLIIARDGRKLYKADPYAFWAEKRPGTASRIAENSRPRHRLFPFTRCIPAAG